MDRVRRLIQCDSGGAADFTGKGVYVAVLDSGVAAHPDLYGRVVAFRDFTDRRNHGMFYDDNGHGTHVCGILAGNGRASMGKYRGVAPECMLLCGKVLDHRGGGNLKSLLEGLKWVMDMSSKYPIKILNISIEMESEENLDHNELKLLKQYMGVLWENNILVVAAAGNRGPKPMTISPISETGNCVCVGCHDGDYIGIGGKTCAEYSGRGPGRKDENGDVKYVSNPLKKPDIVAPGTDIISCNYKVISRNGKWYHAYTAKSGTSMATPLVSGACALCLQKYPQMTNIQLYRKLLRTAQDMGESWNIQGAGLLRVKKLLEDLIV